MPVKNPKLSIYLKPYFATLVMAQMAFFMPLKRLYTHSTHFVCLALRQSFTLPIES